MFCISAVPCFDDNYIWVLRKGRQALAIDPGDAAPLLTWLDRKELELAAVLITHRHADHVGGLQALSGQIAMPVYGPEGIPGITDPVRDGTTLQLLGITIRVMATPGHTREHVSYLTDEAVFCGDTLFGAGCGRVFDGDMAAMHDSLMRLAALAPETLVCCAHEYTQSNLRFAATVEPGNNAIASRISDVRTKRASGQATVPSSVGLELATNPFLRCSEPAVISAARGQHPDAATPVEIFSALREWKNNFR